MSLVFDDDALEAAVNYGTVRTGRKFKQRASMLRSDENKKENVINFSKDKEEIEGALTQKRENPNNGVLFLPPNVDSTKLETLESNIRTVISALVGRRRFEATTFKSVSELAVTVTDTEASDIIRKIENVSTFVSQANKGKLSGKQGAGAQQFDNKKGKPSSNGLIFTDVATVAGADVVALVKAVVTHRHELQERSNKIPVNEKSEGILEEGNNEIDADGKRNDDSRNEEGEKKVQTQSENQSCRIPSPVKILVVCRTAKVASHTHISIKKCVDDLLSNNNDDNNGKKMKIHCCLVSSESSISKPSEPVIINSHKIERETVEVKSCPETASTAIITVSSADCVYVPLSTINFSPGTVTHQSSPQGSTYTKPAALELSSFKQQFPYTHVFVTGCTDSQMSIGTQLTLFELRRIMRLFTIDQQEKSGAHYPMQKMPKLRPSPFKIILCGLIPPRTVDELWRPYFTPNTLKVVLCSRNGKNILKNENGGKGQNNDEKKEDEEAPKKQEKAKPNNNHSGIVMFDENDLAALVNGKVVSVNTPQQRNANVITTAALEPNAQLTGNAQKNVIGLILRLVKMWSNATEEKTEPLMLAPLVIAVYCGNYHIITKIKDMVQSVDIEGIIVVSSLGAMNAALKQKASVIIVVGTLVWGSIRPDIVFDLGTTNGLNFVEHLSEAEAGVGSPRVQWCPSREVDLRRFSAVSDGVLYVSAFPTHYTVVADKTICGILNLTFPSLQGMPTLPIVKQVLDSSDTATMLHLTRWYTTPQIEHLPYQMTLSAVSAVMRLLGERAATQSHIDFAGTFIGEMMSRLVASSTRGLAVMPIEVAHFIAIGAAFGIPEVAACVACTAGDLYIGDVTGEKDEEGGSDTDGENDDNEKENSDDFIKRVRNKALSLGGGVMKGSMSDVLADAMLFAHYLANYSENGSSKWAFAEEEPKLQMKRLRDYKKSYYNILAVLNNYCFTTKNAVAETALLITTIAEFATQLNFLLAVTFCKYSVAPSKTSNRVVFIRSGGTNIVPVFDKKGQSVVPISETSRNFIITPTHIRNGKHNEVYLNGLTAMPSERYYAALACLFPRLEYSKPKAVFSSSAKATQDEKVFMMVSCNGEHRIIQTDVADAALILDLRVDICHCFEFLKVKRCLPVTCTEIQFSEALRRSDAFEAKVQAKRIGTFQRDTLRSLAEVIQDVRVVDTLSSFEGFKVSTFSPSNLVEFDVPIPEATDLTELKKSILYKKRSLEDGLERKASYEGLRTQPPPDIGSVEVNNIGQRNSTNNNNNNEYASDSDDMIEEEGANAFRNPVIIESDSDE